MYILLLIINVTAALVMVGVILLQTGQGAESGSSFGRGAQGSLVNITGSANPLSRATSVLAVIFFVSALALSLVPQSGGETDEVLESLTSEQPIDQSEGSEVPALPSDSNN